MTRDRVALLLFALAVLVGTILDARARTRVLPAVGHLLVADLHVHPYPGDGSLTIAQLQREAQRRGIDVIAITGHNNGFGLGLSRLLGSTSPGVIVIPGQEVTSVDFHLAAVGITELVDWRLTAAQVVAAVQAQGGVAIAAHPVSLINEGWDNEARRLLDGTEVMHPLRLGEVQGGEELDTFFEEVGGVNPSLAPIGSTDFHMTAPLGLCRTYILAEERTAAAALQTIRDGRTAARCADGALIGTPQNVAAVHAALASRPPAVPPSSVEKVCAFLALVSLTLLALPMRR